MVETAIDKFFAEMQAFHESLVASRTKFVQSECAGIHPDFVHKVEAVMHFFTVRAQIAQLRGLKGAELEAFKKEFFNLCFPAGE